MRAAQSGATIAAMSRAAPRIFPRGDFGGASAQRWQLLQKGSLHFAAPLFVCRRLPWLPSSRLSHMPGRHVLSN